MIVTVFRLRVSADPAAQEAYAALAPHIYSLAAAMPGFVAAKRFTADDGERVTIVEFEDEQSHQAWATQHEHVAAKKLGRESFFSEYRIQVCEVKKPCKSPEVDMGHHFSTDLAKSHPQLDLTDVYAFESDQPGKTCLVMIVNPKSKPGDVGNFSPDALYKFHLGDDKLHRSGMIYTIRIQDGLACVGLLEQAQDSTGLPGTELGRAPLAQTTLLGDGIRFWAGTVKDPFFGNQNGLREFRESEAAGALNLSVFKQHAGESPFTGLVSSAIVLEIPNEKLLKEIFYFASVDWHDHGHWHRSNRLAYVLIPHLYLFSATDEQRAHRHEHLPAHDHQYHGLAVATIESYSKQAGFQSDPGAYARRMAEMLLPDAVPYRIGTAAHYGVDGANGRKLTDDAMDVALSWVIGAPFSDEVSQPEGRASNTFPFVVPVT